MSPEEQIACAQEHMKDALNAFADWCTAAPGDRLETAAFQHAVLGLLTSIAHTSMATAQMALAVQP